jgi:hypothetical protein
VYTRDQEKYDVFGVEYSKGTNPLVCAMCLVVLKNARERFDALENHMKGKSGLVAVSKLISNHFYKAMQNYIRAEKSKNIPASFKMLLQDMRKAEKDFKELSVSTKIPAADPQTNFYLKLFKGAGIMNWAFKRCIDEYKAHEVCTAAHPLIRVAKEVNQRLMSRNDPMRLRTAHWKTIHWGYQRFLKLRTEWSAEKFKLYREVNAEEHWQTFCTRLRPCDDLYQTVAERSMCESLLTTIGQFADPQEGMPLVRQIRYGLDFPVLCNSRALGCCAGVESSTCMLLQAYANWDVEEFNRAKCIEQVVNCVEAGVPIPRIITGGYSAHNKNDYPDEMCPHEIPLEARNMNV